MPEIGQTLSHFKIVEKIGEGGMGTVFLAEDLTLDRKVALKFLPDAFTSDPERMARFEREAKLLASLNHPNIAGIYGLEQADGNRFLVLEYVEGETLQVRLSKGALPLEDALALCRQIAEGLEAAHEKGVIHRDLKPANVMITAEEKIKILDFGLAKAFSDDSQSIDSSQSPTITEAMTQPGVILGTAAYMSPEQAKGKSVDKRADIWAFGCILYECLTGKKAFEGETVTETLAAVITQEPDLEKIPVNVKMLLQRCFVKDPKRRLRDIGEAAAWIHIAPEPVPTPSHAKHSIIWKSSTAVFAVAFLLLFFAYFHRTSPIPADPEYLQIVPPVDLAPGGSFVISPDGRILALSAMGTDGLTELWIRRLDSPITKPLPGTKSPHIPPFFWSPDSRFIVFDAGGKLKKVDVSSGAPPVPVCDLMGYAIGGSWNQDDVIIFGNGPGGLMRVPASGGDASPLTRVDTAKHEITHAMPVFLSDGQHFLYFCSSDIPERQGVYLGNLEPPLGPEAENKEPIQILSTDYFFNYIPPKGSYLGCLLYMRDQTLMALIFDEKELTLTGEQIPLAEHTGVFSNYAYVSASSAALIYKNSDSYEGKVTWVNRLGEKISQAGDSGTHSGISLSPDENRAAVGRTRNLSFSIGLMDIRLLDFARGGADERFTFNDSSNVFPVWSPDGNRIVFSSNRDGGIFNLYIKPANGSKNEEPLLETDQNKTPTSWSDDGSYLLYSTDDPETNSDLWALSMERSAKQWVLLDSEFNESDGRFSPDMQWMAYTSDESDRYEVYIRAISKGSGEALQAGAKKQVSQDGGSGPRWREDSRELYYRTPEGEVMAVEIIPGNTLKIGKPESLFRASPDLGINVLLNNTHNLSWDVSRDGERFFLPNIAAGDSPSPYTVILDWTSLLER